MKDLRLKLENLVVIAIGMNTCDEFKISKFLLNRGYSSYANMVANLAYTIYFKWAF